MGSKRTNCVSAPLFVTQALPHQTRRLSHPRGQRPALLFPSFFHRNRLLHQTGGVPGTLAHPLRCSLSHSYRFADRTTKNRCKNMMYKRQDDAAQQMSRLHDHSSPSCRREFVVDRCFGEAIKHAHLGCWRICTHGTHWRHKFR